MSEYKQITLLKDAGDLEVGHIHKVRLATESLLTHFNEKGELSANYRRLLEETLLIAAKAQNELVEKDREITRLRKLSTTDDITGLLNRRGFRQSLERALSRARRQDETGLLVAIDLDGFKAINDRFGHQAGDLVLAAVANLLLHHTRDTDAVARVGGDEFAILLANSPTMAATAKINKLNSTLNNLQVPWEGRDIPVRASFGCTTYNLDSFEENLVRKADMNMYRNKLNGRYNGSTTFHDNADVEDHLNTIIPLQSEKGEAILL